MVKRGGKTFLALFIEYRILLEKKLSSLKTKRLREKKKSRRRRRNHLSGRKMEKYRLTPSNVEEVAKKLMTSRDLIRHRGAFCRAILDAASASASSIASPPALAALVSAVNAEYPDVGCFLVKRMVSQMKSGHKGSPHERIQLFPVLRLFAHLVNQRVVHPYLVLQMIMFLLVVDLRDHSIMFVAILLSECCKALLGFAPLGSGGCMDHIFLRLHEVLAEGKTDPSMIRDVFGAWRDGFAMCPEMVEADDDRVVHDISIVDEIDPEMSLDDNLDDDKAMEEEEVVEEEEEEVLFIVD